MTKKKPNRKKYQKHRKRKRTPKSFVWRWLLVFFILALVLLSLYLLYLNSIVTRQFNATEWSVPSRIYAQSLNLYPGQEITLKQLVRMLRLSSYRHDRQASTQGSFSIHGHFVMISVRAFYRPDGRYVKARMLRVYFANNRISKLLSKNKRLTHAELDPMLIDMIGDGEGRYLIRYQDIPKKLKQAIIASEDKHFYQHLGVDIVGIARSFLANIKAGRIVQGGSTITQQVVKNYFLYPQKTLWRKFNEILMALILEYHYSKQEILTAYVNQVYLGQDKQLAIHGFALAAESFFRRTLQQLSLAQIATLTGLVKGPNYYHPRRHPKRAMQRRNYVLKRMFDDGYISQKQYQKARNQPLGIRNYQPLKPSRFPAFTQWVRALLVKHLDSLTLKHQGLRIYTSLKPWIQIPLQRSFSKSINRLQTQQDVRLQGAMVVSERGSARVVAMLGSRKSADIHFNRAINSQRPIGSLVKPAVFLTALTKGYAPSSLIDDSRIQVKLNRNRSWLPENFDKKSHGRVSLLEALSNSYNQATVRLGMKLGLDAVIQTLHFLGIEKKIQPYPAILLGSLSLSPLQVLQMYQTIADNGFYRPLVGIEGILDKHNKVVDTPFTGRHKSFRFSGQKINQLQQMLYQVVAAGTARKLWQWYPGWSEVMAKTGTSNDFRDSWFVGINQRHNAVVWLGNDHNLSVGLSGARGAMKVWADAMRSIYSVK